MDATGPGDLVECVDGNYPSPGTVPWLGDVPPVLGRIYRVIGGGHCALWNEPFIVVEGAERALGARAILGHNGWALRRFRPISRRSDFEVFLNTVKAPRDDVSAPGKLVPERV